MENTYFHRLHSQTPTRFWINNVTREQADLAIESGAVGCTQNPAYVWKMLTNDQEKSHAFEQLDGILKTNQDNDSAMVELQRALVGDVATHFKPMFDASHGKQGFVSIQGDPFREDSASIVEFARYNRLAGENIMAKIPAVESGLKAIEQLAKERVPINATECMAVRQVMDVCDVYERATRNLVNPAPLYFSVITGIYDEHIGKQVAAGNIDISPDAVWQAG
ncbi:MAG: transaldolase family protein, partial [Pseudoflavonifractor sp.]